MMEDPKTKMNIETPYEKSKDNEKNQLGKNNEAKMTLYNVILPSKTTKEKVKYLDLKAKVTREQTSDDSNSQGGSDEYIDEDEAEAFNLMARNLRKFFCKGNRFRRGSRFSNGSNRFGRGRENGFGNKCGGSSRQKRECYNCEEEGHFMGECPKPKENKTFVRIMFTSYKAYDGGHAVFRSNLKGKVIDGEVEAWESLFIIVGHMLYCIKTNTPFNFACFIARRLSGLDYNNEALPYVRVMTTLFEYIKNKHPNDSSRIIEVDEVTPMYSPLTMESLEL
ncbi:zf-CCHC domain-containing protein [Tanacetum coccineum]